VIILVIATIGCMKESSEYDHQINAFDKEFIGNALYLHNVSHSTSTLVPHRSQDGIVHAFAAASDSIHAIATWGIDSVAHFINISVPPKIDGEIELKSKMLNDLSGRRFDSGYIAVQRDYYRHAVELYTTQQEKGSNASLRNFTSLKLPLFQQQLHSADSLLKHFQ
jgi:predicted outer membrane protein